VFAGQVRRRCPLGPRLMTGRVSVKSKKFSGSISAKGVADQP
jgi:hypothetical protein